MTFYDPYQQEKDHRYALYYLHSGSSYYVLYYGINVLLDVNNQYAPAWINETQEFVMIDQETKEIVIQKNGLRILAAFASGDYKIEQIQSF